MISDAASWTCIVHVLSDAITRKAPVSCLAIM